MTFEDYTREAKRTIPNLGDSKLNQLHMVLGLVTEASEIADTYKKNLAYKKELDLVNIKEELGDLMWYFANLVDLLDFSFEDILDTNIRKLKLRYPDGFTENSAINRNLTEERKLLEK